MSPIRDDLLESTSAADVREQPGEQPPLRVVVVDDHELLRAGTRRILDEAKGFSVVGEAEDGEAALRVVAESDRTWCWWTFASRR